MMILLLYMRRYVINRAICQQDRVFVSDITIYLQLKVEIT